MVTPVHVHTQQLQGQYAEASEQQMRDTNSSVYYRKGCNRIRNYIKANKMQVRLVFTPGRTVEQTFCKSRPLDNNKCVLGNPGRCTICPIISNGTCSIWGAVYQISCRLCNSDIKYQGETERPLHHSLKEHVRAAANPTAYPENALGQHYAELHTNCNVMLDVYILDIQQKTSRRKLSEALFIHKNKPTLNDKSELESVVKFIV